MEWIRSDERRHEAAVWAKWFGRIPRIRNDFFEAIEDDPLLYNETASVGVLACAASRSGLLALAEYSAIKRGTGRGRPHGNGRCDLWVAEPGAEFSWAFEFKQLFCPSNPRTKTIAAALTLACKDVDKIHPLEAKRRFGGLLVSAREGCTLSEPAIGRIVAVAQSATFACRLDGGKTPVYLILQELNR
jgi:hypothetical protein